MTISYPTLADIPKSQRYYRRHRHSATTKLLVSLQPLDSRSVAIEMTVGISFPGFEKGSSGKRGLVEVVKHVNGHFPIDTGYSHYVSV